MSTITLANLDIDTAVKYIANGIEDDLKKRIKDVLQQQADVVIEEVAVKLCKDFKAILTGFENFGDKSIKIGLVINKEDIKWVE